jgi:hypothetical protein
MISYFSISYMISLIIYSMISYMKKIMKSFLETMISYRYIMILIYLYMHTFTGIVLDPRWLAGSGALPPPPSPDIADDDDDMDYGLPDPHDDADFGHGDTGSAPGPSRSQAGPLDPFASFI